MRESWGSGGLGRENARTRERESEEEEGGEKKGEEVRWKGVCERVSEWVKANPREGRRDTERARNGEGEREWETHACTYVYVYA